MSYSAKTKRDGWTDGQTDGQTGGIAISPVPGPTAPAGDKKTLIKAGASGIVKCMCMYVTVYAFVSVSVCECVHVCMHEYVCSVESHQL